MSEALKYQTQNCLVIKCFLYLDPHRSFYKLGRTDFQFYYLARKAVVSRVLARRAFVRASRSRRPGREKFSFLFSDSCPGRALELDRWRRLSRRGYEHGLWRNSNSCLARWSVFFDRISSLCEKRKKLLWASYSLWRHKSQWFTLVQGPIQAVKFLWVGLDEV